MVAQEGNHRIKEHTYMSNVQFLLDFFNREHYQMYYTPVAKALKSIEAAILFSEFVQRHQYHKARDELIEIPGCGDDWFYHTREAIEERTAINKRQMDYAVNILKEHKLIETKNYGLPCKRYFRLNLRGIEDFSKNLSSLNTVCKLAGTQCANRIEHSVQTDSLYIEEPKEEPKKDKNIAQPAAPLRSKDASLSFSFEKQQFENISQGDIASWQELYPAIDINREIKEMIQWILANPSKAKSKRLWRKFILGWLQRSNEKSVNRLAYQSTREKQVLSRHTGFQKDERPVHPSRTKDYSKCI